jgi:hypothetical protein
LPGLDTVFGSARQFARANDGRETLLPHRRHTA